MIVRALYPRVVLGETVDEWFVDVYRQIAEALGSEDLRVLLPCAVYEEFRVTRVFGDTSMLDWLRRQLGVAEIVSLAPPLPCQVIAEYETTVTVGGSDSRELHAKLQKLWGYRDMLTGPERDGAVAVPPALTRASGRLNTNQKIAVVVVVFADGTFKVSATPHSELFCLPTRRGTL